MLLIIKGKMNWDISSCNLSCFTACNVEMVLRKICFNAVGVAFLIAQGCQTIVQATLGWRMLCVEQRHRCCAF